MILDEFYHWVNRNPMALLGAREKLPPLLKKSTRAFLFNGDQVFLLPQTLLKLQSLLHSPVVIVIQRSLKRLLQRFCLRK